jgi:hydrogenase maturation protease
LPGDDPLIGAAAGGDAGSLDAALPGPAPADAGALIVCYGNPLRGDDALGWHASELLATDPRLGGATVIWRHQLTPDLAADIKDASLVILVDVNVLDEPGVVSVRRADAGGSVATGPGVAGSEAATRAAGSAGPSSHHVAPAELMALAHELWGASPAVYVVSAGAQTLEIGDGLSPAVEAALPAVVDAVASIVAGHGDLG